MSIVIEQKFYQIKQYVMIFQEKEVGLIFSRLFTLSNMI